MTVRLLTANLQFTRTAAKHDDYLAHLVEGHWTKRPATRTGLVIGTQETKNYRLLGALRSIARLAGKARLPVPEVFQGNGAAQSGTALAAYGIDLRHPGIWLGGQSRATLPRWVTRAGVDVPGGRCEVLDAHIPPPRSGKAPQQAYIGRVKRRTKRAEKRGHAWAVTGDFNTDLFAVAKQLNGVAYGLRGGIGIVVSKNLKVSHDGRDDYGVDNHLADHPAWWIDVEGIQTRKA